MNILSKSEVKKLPVFSQNLRALRNKFGLTQLDAAHCMGIKRCKLGAYEEGRAEPSLDLLVIICNVYKIRNPLKIIKERI